MSRTTQPYRRGAGRPLGGALTAMLGGTDLFGGNPIDGQREFQRAMTTFDHKPPASLSQILLQSPMQRLGQMPRVAPLQPRRNGPTRSGNWTGPVGPRRFTRS